MAPALISYSEAKAKGLKRYFTGKPCKRGHIAEREISSCGCLECRNENARKYKAGNREKVRAAYKKYAAENRPQLTEKMRRWRIANPKQRLHQRLKLFGLTNDQYEEMYQAQNGVCAICSSQEWQIHGKSKQIQRLSVDHCHKTSQVRGLLCHRCNRLLGMLQEDLCLLKSIEAYLRFHKTRNE